MALKKWYANVYKNDQPIDTLNPLYVGNAYDSEEKAKNIISNSSEFTYLKTILFEIEDFL